LDTAFSIQYATGSVAGSSAQETMSFGGISIQKQTLGLVNTAGAELQQTSCDGIVVRFCDSTSCLPTLGEGGGGGGGDCKVASRSGLQ